MRVTVCAKETEQILSDCNSVCKKKNRFWMSVIPCEEPKKQIPGDCEPVCKTDIQAPGEYSAF